MQLRSSGGRVPLLYGLPKVRKQAVPLRPIVSFVTSPTYQLSKFLVGVLAPLVGQTSSYVKNSKSFAEFITTQALTTQETLVSFDVVSLFTCIPTGLAVQVARQKLEEDPSLPERTDLSVDNIVGLLNLYLDATFLSFRGKVDRQVHGTAMRSLVSVVIANLVMEDVEERALATFHSPPRFWKRYVDNTCTALPRDMVKSFHSHLNNIEPCMQFTVEEESEDRILPFLDVELCRESDGTVTTSVYRKTTHTNQYLSFASHHPVTHKGAVVSTLMSRANTLSSSGLQRVEEEKKIVDALKENGYPSRFIRKHSCPTRHRQEVDVRKPRTTVTLPYINGLSEAVRRILTQLDIKVVFRPLGTLRHMLVHSWASA